MANELTELMINCGALAQVDGDNYLVSVPGAQPVQLIRSHKDEKGNDLGDGDFGVIPHTPKPSLFKQGADKIRIAYGFFERHTPVPELCVCDYEKGFMRYVDKCELVKLNVVTGQEYVFASYVASANNYENRNGKAAGTMGVDNNCVKIAEKRSMVSAVISVANLSGLFTMDIEDDKLSKAATAVFKASDEEFINASQVKLYWVNVDSSGRTKAEGAALLKDLGYNSSKEIRKRDFGDLLELVAGHIDKDEFISKKSEREAANGNKVEEK